MQENPTPVLPPKKRPSARQTVSTSNSNESIDSQDGRGIVEYEQDVSSRGRLRKRRLIPNNIEDQGVKKKKVKKGQ